MQDGLPGELPQDQEQDQGEDQADPQRGQRLQEEVISWLLLLLSLVPLTMGLILLHKMGKPGSSRQSDQALLSFEKTSHLVKVGIFRYIRHPLYASLLLLSWGIFFKHITWFSLILTLLASLSLFLTALAEEKEMLQFFGNEYLSYMKETKRFIPFVF